ncbi:MAG: protein kinase domain-containing protein [Gemmatimonadaceae bacterium]
MTDLPPMAAALVAALADRYRLERTLGAGGMATVYLAQDLKHGRRVAIKVLRPDVAEAIGAPRFLAEIRTTANLHHPHIVPLHDSGSVGEFLYYVMPCVEGISLRERLQTAPQLALDEALRIFGQVASALEYAHRHGVVHRDIKPENILLQDDQALVADFGIALITNADATERITRTGVSLGTPQYMSPEYVTGEGHLDARSDIYSLGVTMYEALAGVLPFTGATAQAVVAKALTTDPAPLGKFRPGLPAEIETAVMTAIQRDPANRFQSAAALRAALQPDAGMTEAGPRSGVLRPRLRWLAGLAAGIAIVAGGYTLLGGGAPARPRSVVALPFESLSADTAATGYLADGIPDELLAALANAPGLAVRPMPRDPRFRGHPDLANVGRELHADVVLTGILIPEGDSVRITVRPYDVARNAYLSSLTYTAVRTNVFGLEDSISSAVAERLHLQPASERRLLAGAHRGRPGNSAAHDTLLLARWYSEKRDCTSLNRAIALLEEATHLDSSYALAWSELGHDHDLRAAFFCARGIDEFVPARAAISRALALDPDLAEAHMALSFLHIIADWDWTGAEDESARAIALDSTSADIWLFHGWSFVAMGQMDSAVASMRHALAIDPTSLIVLTRVGTTLLWSGDAHSAIPVLEAVLARNPRFQPAQTDLADAYSLTGRCADALRLTREAYDPHVNAGTMIAAEARCRDSAGARAALGDWERRIDAGEFFSPLQVAEGYAALGDKREMLRWLRRAFDERDWEIWSTRVQTMFVAYASDPAFRALVDQAHLAAPSYQGR